MGFDIESAFGLFISPIIFILSGILWKKFPPKKINYLYGYRTRRSMANQQIWKYANELGAQMFVSIGLILLICAILLMLLLPKHAVITSLFLMLIGIGFGMFWCETKLNKRFDKNGNPK